MKLDKKVPIRLQSSQNRIIIKNGTVVNHDKEEQVDVYVEVIFYLVCKKGLPMSTHLFVQTQLILNI